MKALTIAQPYAHLILTGEKRVENRTWNPRHRGLLVIHAGKSREWLDTHSPLPEGMVFGAALGTVTLISVLPITRIEAWRMGRGNCPARQRLILEHEHTEGPWCWILSDPKPFPEPIPCKGALGLWEFAPSQ